MLSVAKAAIAGVLMAVAANLYAVEPPELPELPTVISACPTGYAPAYVHLDLAISTNSDGCPLLEDKELRKLIEKFGMGTTFAWPAIPYTCISGTGLVGSITFDGEEIAVEGFSESAQRLFPEAEALNPSYPLFVVDSGGAFASGAAMTVVLLSGISDDFSLTLVLADRFTVNNDTNIDTEDFLVVGSKGDYQAVGRLTGYADIDEGLEDPLSEDPLNVSGTVCLKE